MRPLTWHFRASAPVQGAVSMQDSGSVMGISSDMEQPEPIFDICASRRMVYDYELLSQPIGAAGRWLTELYFEGV